MRKYKSAIILFLTFGIVFAGSAILFSVMHLETKLPIDSALFRMLLGDNPAVFGIKLGLYALLLALALVPSIRHDFMGGVSLGNDYKSQKKSGKKRGGRRI